MDEWMDGRTQAPHLSRVSNTQLCHVKLLSLVVVIEDHDFTFLPGVSIVVKKEGEGVVLAVECPINDYKPSEISIVATLQNYKLRIQLPCPPNCVHTMYSLYESVWQYEFFC